MKIEWLKMEPISIAFYDLYRYSGPIRTFAKIDLPDPQRSSNTSVRAAVIKLIKILMC